MCLFFLLFLAACRAPEEGRWFRVRYVPDGDTVQLSGGTWVRYIGIDTPEMNYKRGRPEPYARQAMVFNRRLVEGKRIRLEFDTERRDRYGRLLAYVYLEDGTFVNAELIRRGCARILTIPPNVRYADRFQALEREAREAGRGLWSAP